MTDIFASALHLDRIAVQALKLTDTYSLHRVVYSLFADTRSAEEKQGHARSGIVYADQGGDIRGRKVLILSDRPPASRVDGQFGRVETKTIADTFLSHQRYRFQVQINPVRKSQQSGRREAVKGRENIAQWFIQRASQSWGFTVDEQLLEIEAVKILQFKDKAGRQVTIGQADIRGQLTVTDSMQFSHSFKQGIGKGRAFGCGLLQIIPIIDHPFNG